MIRRLDITILKGILENRSSTSWACFIVEVKKNMLNFGTYSTFDYIKVITYIIFSLTCTGSKRFSQDGYLMSFTASFAASKKSCLIES